MVKRIMKASGLVAIVAILAGLSWFVFVSPYQVYVVHTGSMGHTIPSRSAVFVHDKQYHVGQVVTFRVNGEVVTHRLLAIQSDGTITTKGDANRTDDPWHPSKSSIIGGVVSAPSDLGWWLVFVRQPTGIPTILLIGVFIWLLWSTDEKPIDKVEPTLST